MSGALQPVLAEGDARLDGHAALTAWTFAPLVSAALAVAALLYVWGVWRVWRRHPVRPWPVWRSASFLTGLAVIALATESSVGTYDDVLFWVHMVQHLLLVMVAPPLLIVGRPVLLALHASRNPAHRWVRGLVRSRVVSVLTWPPVGLALYAAVIVGTHLSSFMNLVLEHPLIHDAEHGLYLVVGYLFFLPVIGSEPIRWRLSVPARLVLLAVAMPVDTFTGVVLGMTSREPFPAYADRHRSWGPGLVDDLHLGGAVMWVGGDALMLVLMVVLAVNFARQGTGGVGVGAGRWLEAARTATLASHAAAAGIGRPAESGREATVDDEQHYAAYNAYLAALADPAPADSVPADSVPAQTGRARSGGVQHRDSAGPV